MFPSDSWKNDKFFLEYCNDYSKKNNIYDNQNTTSVLLKPTLTKSAVTVVCVLCRECFIKHDKPSTLRKLAINRDFLSFKN